MKNVEKYERQYFLPPVTCMEWTKKDYIEKPQRKFSICCWGFLYVTGQFFIYKVLKE